MRWFTDAARAEDDWEAVLRDYGRHLDELMSSLSPQLAEFAAEPRFHLHDAEFRRVGCHPRADPADCEIVCACDFTACCDVSQPTVSHHLRVLREAGWVTTERRGTWIYYSLRPEAAERFRQLSSGIAGSASPRRLSVLQPASN